MGRQSLAVAIGRFHELTLAKAALNKLLGGKGRSAAFLGRAGL